MDEPYIFAYFLGANPEYRRQVRKLAESTGLKIVALRHMDQYVEDDESFGDYAPYDVAPASLSEFVTWCRVRLYGFLSLERVSLSSMKRNL